MNLQSPISLSEALAIATHRLTAAGYDTPRLDAEVLLAHSLGQERSWLYLHLLDPLDQNQINQFEKLLHRREQREPVAYIVGHREFFGLEFEINLHVLIPRPETELLIETALEIYDLKFLAQNPKSEIHARKGSPKSKIVDVGTGSGCIAVTLAKYVPNSSIFAIDASPAALELARRNAKRHAVADRIAFLSGDLLEAVTEPVDLIVSNPPYVSRAELAVAMPEVSRYEPRLALDGGEDGLDIIRRLLPQAREKLKPGGCLLVEIGSSQAQVVIQLAETYFPKATIQVKKDLAGLDRLLVVEI